MAPKLSSLRGVWQTFEPWSAFRGISTYKQDFFSSRIALYSPLFSQLRVCSVQSPFQVFTSQKSDRFSGCLHVLIDVSVASGKSCVNETLNLNSTNFLYLMLGYKLTTSLRKP